MVKNEKVKSIFMGRITKKKYDLNRARSVDGKFHSGKPYIYEFIETESREKIADCEITRPPFEEKETVYIPEIGKYTTIDKVSRSTDGSIYYNVTYVIKEIENNEDKNDIEVKLAEELIKYDEYIEQEEKKRIVQSEERKSKVLYLETTYNVTDSSCSIISYYGDRKYRYNDITLSNLEQMLKSAYNLGIDKENTLIYINATGIGMWIYDTLSSRGYNIKSLFESTKVLL